MCLCEVCGNEMSLGTAVCRFCGSPQSEAARRSVKKKFRHKVVNLERGMPAAEAAISRLEGALAEARMRDISIMTIIHGYGSSGRGGKIRRECRKILDYRCSRGELAGYIPGEDFTRRNGKTKTLLKQFPKLVVDKNLDRANQGITIVVL